MRLSICVLHVVGDEPRLALNSHSTYLASSLSLLSLSLSLSLSLAEVARPELRAAAGGHRIGLFTVNLAKCDILRTGDKPISANGLQLENDLNAQSSSWPYLAAEMGGSKVSGAVQQTGQQRGVHGRGVVQQRGAQCQHHVLCGVRAVSYLTATLHRSVGEEEEEGRER